VVGVPVAGFLFVMRKRASVESGDEDEGERIRNKRERSRIGNEALDHQIAVFEGINLHCDFDVPLHASA